MKKLAALVALSLPALGVYAQSTVTMYGLIDAGLTYADPGAGGKLHRLDSGIAGGSRLGFRVNEDMGGNLRANAVLEMGFGIDNGNLQQGGLAFGRQIYVGLSGRQWTLTAGRQYGPNEIAMTQVEAFGQNYWGSSAGYGIGTLQSPGSAAIGGAGCQGASVRLNNSVQGTYTAGGVTGKLLIGAGDENDRGTGRYINPSVTYASGPLVVAAGYARMRQCAPDIAAAAAPDWQSEIVAGAAYDFGVAKLFVGYYNWNPSEANKTVSPTTYVNHKVLWVGTRVRVGGQGTVIAQVARVTDEFRGQDNAVGTSVGLTYEHALSKRTRAYVSGGYLKNNERARFGLAAATSGLTTAGLGADPKVLSVGMVHSF